MRFQIKLQIHFGFLFVLSYGLKLTVILKKINFNASWNDNEPVIHLEVYLNHILAIKTSKAKCQENLKRHFFCFAKEFRCQTDFVWYFKLINVNEMEGIDDAF